MWFQERIRAHKKAPESTPETPAVTGPIIASIGPRASHKRGDIEEIDKRKLEKVDYYDDPERMSRKNQKNAGSESYVISDASSSDKTSHGYRNCTGVVVVGVDKASGKNISILTHQDPQSFLTYDKEQFEKDFTDSLRQLASLVDGKTIDAVLFGGNYFVDERSATGTNGTYADDYRNSIKILRRLITSAIGVEPHVVIGPQTLPWSDVAVTFDTEKRRLYMYRPVQKKIIHDVSFPASAIAEHDKKWRDDHQPPL